MESDHLVCRLDLALTSYLRPWRMSHALTLTCRLRLHYAKILCGGITSSLLAVLSYFIYLKTVKKHKDKKQLAKQDEETASGTVKDVELSQDAKKRVCAFID